jgi:hypothetical protein
VAPPPQGHYFSELDLAAIAQELDRLEAEVLGGEGLGEGEHGNLDDSGMFSSQVGAGADGAHGAGVAGAACGMGGAGQNPGWSIDRRQGQPGGTACIGSSAVCSRQGFLALRASALTLGGHFLVQVLSKALELWQLQIVPYKSQAIREQAGFDPVNEVAFICNLQARTQTYRAVGLRNSVTHWNVLLCSGVVVAAGSAASFHQNTSHCASSEGTNLWIRERPLAP